MKYTLVQPLLTEKSLKLASQGQFTFLVVPSATKAQISDSVAAAFNVTVTKVTTSTLPGKSHRSRRGYTTLTSARKKSIVTLKSGQTIDIFTQVKS